MPNSPETLRLLVDRLLDGQLDELLREWADARVNGPTSARLLALRLGGIELDGRTVTRWMRTLDDQAA